MTVADNVAVLKERAAHLPLWRTPVTPVQLLGGTTNVNFMVDDGAERYVVRVGDDIPVHHILRFNERAANEAAFAAGVSPEVVYTEPGIMVMRFVDGRTLTAADVRAPDRLARILPLVKRVHREMPRHLRGPILVFWVFHVIRDYAHQLAPSASRYASRVQELVDIATDLELAVGPTDFVFGHNDLLAGNIIDDGDRVWLIDWDYAGFNSPLFDLANLASNSEFEPDQETWMLATYFGRAPDAGLWRSYRAMKVASLLRESMWSMVSELHSRIDFDYAAYTIDYLDRFARALDLFERTRD